MFSKTGSLGATDAINLVSGEQSGLLTRTATESVTLCAPMKN